MSESTGPLSFELLKQDGQARRGRVTTLHGTIETPAFMPVGTRATVKGLMPRDLAETGSEICLANTYHLHVAPGDQIVKKLGGLHKMMGWDRPILTDSGGFQVFSLPKLQMDEEGVTFRFEKSGAPVKLTPERSMLIQNNLGADIIMAFDVCVPYPSERQQAQDAVYQTERWLRRCKAAHARPDEQALFGIVQGSTYPDLRRLSAQLTSEIDLPGYAVGGVSVGEGHQLMMDVVENTAPYMPVNKPRYLMGVGLPEDLIEAVARGIDMFDCVLPSRYGRSGVLFTRRGAIRVTKGKYRKDGFPVDTQCQCYGCQNFSRGYINHLLNSKEILGSVLGTLHNITFYQDLMRATRASIEQGTFESFRSAFLAEYLSEDRIDALNLHAVTTNLRDDGDGDVKGLSSDDDASDDAPTKPAQRVASSQGRERSAAADKKHHARPNAKAHQGPKPRPSGKPGARPSGKPHDKKPR